MKNIAKSTLTALFLAVFLVLGFLLIAEGVDMLTAGELTYTGKRDQPVTVSPNKDAFSFYYQVAFFVTLGMAASSFALSASLFAFERMLRQFGSDAGEQLARRSQRIGVQIAYASGVFGGAWLLLHVFRYSLIQ